MLDVSYLLARIDELEREKEERHKHYASGAGDCWMRLQELERENARMREDMRQRHTSDGGLA